ncbi:MAG: hypothetical protein HFG74_10305 [Hungatella sp.]|nr:hypothetical protein [Hungatella sp.]
MVALKVEDIKQFTSGLFIGSLFDKFQVREAEIVTFNAFHMDGRIRPGYYTKEETEEKGIGEYSVWESVKPVCFSLIKGKRLPGSFQIVLQLGKKQLESFLAGRQVPVRADQIGGMYLNIRYENGELYCVTGTSVNFFTLDKSLDMEWDEAMKEFFRKKGIPFTM